MGSTSVPDARPDGEKPARKSSERGWTQPKYLFLYIFAFRLANVLLIRTTAQADEYYQALEPGWRFAFGPQSDAYMTWEWALKIRTSLYPIFNGLLYRLVDAVAAPSIRSELLVVAPKIAQAAIVTCADYFTFRLADVVFRPAHIDGGHQSANAALVLTLTSFWNWTFSSRTLSNSIETALTAYGLAAWPWYELEPTMVSWMPSFTAAAVATILRPPNALVWATVAGLSFFSLSWQAWMRCVWAAVGCGSAVLAVSAVADFYFFDEWTLPVWNFVDANIFQSLSEFYGVNRVDLYLTEGFPLLMMGALPFGLYGVWAALQSTVPPFLAGLSQPPARAQALGRIGPTKVLASVVLVLPALLSMVGHKEVRFICPILPAFFVLAAPVCSVFFTRMDGRSVRLASRFRTGILTVMVLVNVLVSGYLTMVHNRGPVSVVDFLRREHEASGKIEAGLTTSVGFLMPCHSTPWRSHLVHKSIAAWAITCEPPVGIEPHSTKWKEYKDEMDVFFEDPRAWLDAYVDDEPKDGKASVVVTNGGFLTPYANRPWPDRLVMFEGFIPTARELIDLGLGSAPSSNTSADQSTTSGLANKNSSQYVAGSPAYRECWRAFNTHFADHSRKVGDVVVFCSDPPAA